MCMVYFPPEQVRAGNITSVKMIDKSFYDEKLPLRYKEFYKPGELLETKTHYRWGENISPGLFAVPAFQFYPNGDELLEGCHFGYSTSEDSEKFHEFNGPDENGLYYDMPKLEKKNGVFRLKNTLEGSSLGSVQPGNTKLLLKDSNFRVIFSWNLTIWPSSLSKEEFRFMINEILCIDRRLLQFQSSEGKSNSNNVGLNFKRMTITELWEQTLQDMEHDVATLGRLFQRMEKSPHFSLMAKPCKCNLQNVKRIDQDILRQYAQMPSRKYFRTRKAYKSRDIYEHRFLKQTLKQLYAFLEHHQKSLPFVSYNIKEKEMTLMDKMCQILGNVTYNQIEAKWKQYVTETIKLKDELDALKEKYFDEFVKSYKKSQCYSINRARRKISFRVAKLSTKDILCKAEELQWEYELQWQKKSYDSEHSWKGVIISDEKKFLEKITVQTWDIGSQYAFYRALIEERDDEGTSDGIKIDVVGDFRQTESKRNGCIYVEITFFKLYELCVDGRSVPISRIKTDEWEKQVVDIGNAYAKHLENKDKKAEKVLLDYGIMNSIESQRKALENMRNEFHLHETDGYSRIDLIKQKLAVLQKSVLFVDLPAELNMSIPWKMTQIFSNDKNYSAAYKLLPDMNKRYDFTFEITDEHIIHEKLDRIYEYWIFAKILEYLVLTQGWYAKNLSPAKVLSDFLQQGAVTKPNCIHLNHKENQNFQLDIFFDTPMRDSIGIKTSEKYSYELRPDFLFRLSQTNHKNEPPLYFILDVKYRDYAMMDGLLANEKKDGKGYNHWIKKDLAEVCFDKYYKCLQNFGINISAAFIVHSDRTLTGGVGKYVTYDAYNDKRCENIFYMKPSKSKKDKCRIGSFYMVPHDNNVELNQSLENLQSFFQLLCEDYAREWKQCWCCGSRDISYEVLYTEKGYKKYHLWCNSCHAFWVKTHCYDCGNNLVKHVFNHYVEKNPGYHWMVICPVCMPKEKDSNCNEYDGINEFYQKLETDLASGRL